MKTMYEALRALELSGDETLDEMRRVSYKTITSEVIENREVNVAAQRVIFANVENIAPGLMEILIEESNTPGELQEHARAALAAIKVAFACGIIVGIEMEKQEL